MQERLEAAERGVAAEAAGDVAEDTAEEVLDGRGVQGAKEHLRGEGTGLDLGEETLDDGLDATERELALLEQAASEAAEDTAEEALDGRGVKGAEDHLGGKSAGSNLAEEALDGGLKAAEGSLARLQTGGDTLGLALDTGDGAVNGVGEAVELASVKAGDVLDSVGQRVKLTLLESYVLLVKTLSNFLKLPLTVSEAVDGLAASAHKGVDGSSDALGSGAGSHVGSLLRHATLAVGNALELALDALEGCSRRLRLVF